MHYILVGNGKMAQTYFDYAQRFGDICDGIFDKNNIHMLEQAGTTQILIDFSSPDSLTWITDYLHKNPMPFISGTTGFCDEQYSVLKLLAAKMPVMHCPNFSLGLMMLSCAAKQISELSSSLQFDLILTEKHHKTKSDIPSGTACKLADIAKIPRENIVSYRAGDIVGVHTLSCYGAGEALHFTHIAQNRTVFAAGARLAALNLIGKKNGWYRFEDLWEGK